MGGHSAWRKRVANGETAIRSGGAVMRHSPHFNRGKPLPLDPNRRKSGNPKKRKTADRSSLGGDDTTAAAAAAAAAALSPPAYIMVDNQALPFRYGKWLCLSSLTFLAPVAIVFVLSRRPDHCDGGAMAPAAVPWPLVSVHMLTAAASVNFWRSAFTSGLRRTLDVVVARVSFATTFTYGVQHVRKPMWLRHAGYIIAGTILGLYPLSIRLHKEGSFAWLPVHFIMHLFIGAGMAIVAYGVMSECQQLESRDQVSDLR